MPFELLIYCIHFSSKKIANISQDNIVPWLKAWLWQTCEMLKHVDFFFIFGRKFVRIVHVITYKESQAKSCKL